jgi:hypothetical protein
VFDYPGIATTATKLLVVQRQGTEDGTKSPVWRDAVNQLNEYWYATHDWQRPANCSAVYEVACVGLTMRVYKYDYVNRQILDWAPRGLTRGTKYLFHNDHVKFQRILDAIRNDH